jgi:exopolyphosphatase/guanosine-5'-triphosphate,3'-diphosphate pyrophosphatase
VEQLFLFATSAIRDATNRDDILDRIEHRTGVRPQYLTGEDEARLTYVAAHRWYGWSAGRILLFDIGGGSLEIALGRDAEPDLTLSLPLGAGRLTRQFLRDDPPSRGQVKAVQRHVRDMLREVADRLRWEGAPSRAVGTSKTFKQLARLAGGPPQRKGPFVRRTLRREALDKWIPQLADMRAAERARLRGISGPRAKQVLAGAIVAKAMMSALDIKEVDICPWALREGIMLHHLASLQVHEQTLPLQTIKATPPSPDAALLRSVPEQINA